MDGAACNMGAKNGVAKKMNDIVENQVIVTHCCPIKDIVENQVIVTHCVAQLMILLKIKSL